MRFLVLVLLFEKFANWPKLSFSIVIVFVCLDDLAAYDGRTITDETFYKTVFSEFARIRRYNYDVWCAQRWYMYFNIIQYYGLPIAQAVLEVINLVVLIGYLIQMLSVVV